MDSGNYCGQNEEFTNVDSYSYNYNDNDSDQSENYLSNYDEVLKVDLKVDGGEESESKEEEEEDEEVKIDWNRQFREIMSLPDSAEKYRSLSRLAKDFVHASKLYAKIIISELYLPDDKKTIKPVQLGGVAGGDKYICQGILFKFALDLAGIYGGDQNAMKAAGHELKGLMCFYNCQIPELNVPLMALIDYRGFRVVAMSVLPVKKDSIIYGSQDGGVTVHADNPKLNSLMKMAGKMLNLKPHLAGKDKTKIYGPADIEGHLSPDDNMFYLLDFARTMPPQVTLHKDRGRRHLFELLRPEFVRSNNVPLSSDALTGMGKWDPEQATHNAEIKDACKRLFTELIPTFAKTTLVQSSEEILVTPSQPQMIEKFEKYLNNITPDEIVLRVHRAGINIRHLGFVRMNVKNEYISKLILEEMVARVIKDQIYASTRETMKKLKIPSDEPYRAVIVDIINQLFVENRTNYWTKDVKVKLMDKFLNSLFANEVDSSFNLLTLINIPNLIKRLGQLTNIYISPQAIGVLDFGTTKIVDSDLSELDAKVKGMNIVSEASAMVLYYEALQRKGSEANRLFQKAIDKFKEAIVSSPNSRFAFYAFGKMLHNIAKITPDGDTSIYLLTNAIEKLEQAVHIDPRFFEGRLELAETLINFVVNKRRLWLIYRKDNKDFINALGALLERAGEHLKLGLQINRNLSNSSDEIDLDTLKGKDVDEYKVKAIKDVMKSCSDIKLLAYLEASEKSLSLRNIINEMLYKKSMFFIEMEGTAFFKTDTLKKFSEIVGGNLTRLIFRHAVQMNDSAFSFILSKLTNLETLEISGAENLTSFPSVYSSKLTNINLAGCNVKSLFDFSKKHVVKLVENAKILTLSGSNVTDGQISKICEVSSNLVSMSLAKFRDHLYNVKYLLEITSPTINSFPKTVKELNFSGCVTLKNHTLQSLAKSSLPLERLNISSCSAITDDGVISLIKKCHHTLTDIDLSSTGITEVALKTIYTCTSLSRLKLEMCSGLKGNNLKKLLEKCKSLKLLNLAFWKNELIDPEIFTWSSSSSSSHTSGLKFPSLTSSSSSSNLFESSSSTPTQIYSSLNSLNLCNWNVLTNEMMSRLLMRTPNLTKLNISNCFQLTNQTIEYISKYCSKTLKILMMRSCPVVNNKGIEILCSSCTDLTELVLDGCNDLSKDGMMAIGDGCKKLASLSLNQLKKITNEDIQYILYRCTDLEFLSLEGCAKLTGDFLYQSARHQCAKLVILTRGSNTSQFII
eukprot:TRINITY_DN385_c1_g1_i1.p1 TRINITY_DN385_c1_g1~~TRINITY_DN385_c1_g1_i1.p1  ORF type:complete len:1249 (+),score=314.60 TRINITY_DN385_c1_g1_i1:1159-4905(+)